MNTPVSFEIAKLLKEKGFDKECWNYYTLAYGKKPYITQGIEYQSDAKIKFDWNCNNEDSKRIQAPYPNTFHPSQCSAPTISEVVMWLYEKHGMWIVSIPSTIGEGFDCNYYVGKDKFGINKHPSFVINSPTDAYEAAIEYTLINLL